MHVNHGGLELRGHESVDKYWGEQNIQEQLDGVSRNKSIYEKIAAAMRQKGTDLIIISIERKLKTSLPSIAR